MDTFLWTEEKEMIDYGLLFRGLYQNKLPMAKSLWPTK